MVALHWEHYFKRICEKYNGIYRTSLPEIPPHICRHTYCSNMAKSGMNPKTLQYLMGHSDIGITLNTYTHLEFEDVEVENRGSYHNTKRVKIPYLQGFGRFWRLMKDKVKILFICHGNISRKA